MIGKDTLPEADDPVPLAPFRPTAIIPDINPMLDNIIGKLPRIFRLPLVFWRLEELLAANGACCDKSSEWSGKLYKSFEAECASLYPI